MAEADSSDKAVRSSDRPHVLIPARRNWVDREVYGAWTIALVVSLTFSLGISPALRGTTVGLEIWIDRSDRIASFLGQASALIGSILSMRFLLTELPRKRPWMLSAAVGVLSTIPLIALLSATRGTLGERFSTLNAGVVGLIALLVTLAHVSLRSRAALLPGFAAVAIGGRVWLSFEHGQPWVSLVVWVSLGASVLASLVAIGMDRIRKPAVVASVSLVGTDFLLRICRGSLDPLFGTWLSGAPSLTVPIWLLLPVAVFAHFRGGSLRNVGAPLVVLASVSPLTPLSLLAATNGLLCLLPETISQSARKQAPSETPQ